MRWRWIKSTTRRSTANIQIEPMPNLVCPIQFTCLRYFVAAVHCAVPHLAGRRHTRHSGARARKRAPQSHRHHLHLCLRRSRDSRCDVNISNVHFCKIIASDSVNSAMATLQHITQCHPDICKTVMCQICNYNVATQRLSKTKPI